MLTRIQRLRDYRIFRDFSWPEDLHDFGRYNVIYGWNGVGKTTLSTLFRHLQRREAVTEGTVDFRFDKILVRGSEISDSVIPAVRVFNREFIGRSIFETNSGHFPPVYYFGEDSVEKQRQIAELVIQRQTYHDEQSRQSQLLVETKRTLETFSTDQAKVIRTMLTVSGGGKYNNFNAGHFKAEMQKLTASTDPALRLNKEERTTWLKITESRPLPTLSQVTIRFPDLMSLRTKTEELLEKTVISSVLQDLAEDKAVASWVEQGLNLHRDTRRSEHCRFCEQPLPETRITALEAHFNDAFERQKQAISELLADVDAATRFSLSFTPPAHEALYEILQPEYKEALRQVRKHADALTDALEALKKVLEAKRDDPFKKLELDSLLRLVLGNSGGGLSTFVLSVLAIAAESRPFLASFEGTKAVESLNRLISEHNKQTSLFDAKVAKARDTLAHDEMLGALSDWRTKSIAIERAKHASDAASRRVAQLDEEILQLEAQVQQHHQPAEELNREVAAYLGRDELQFVTEQSGYRIMRSGQAAHHLSDGERTAIAFLYFLKSLQGTDFNLEEGLVVIDDPVSSLDTNSLFSAFGFMKARTANVKQLIILTHSFSFFRQIRNWFDSLNKAGSKKKGESAARFFMLRSMTQDGIRGATLGAMDGFLTDYESEYQYLFKQVFKASQTEPRQSLEQYYGMPNIARRLLETFLAYRIPSKSGDLYGKLNAIEGDIAVKTRVLRFLHTYSHGDAVAQADHDPTLLTETPAVLREVLSLIQTNDAIHYNEMTTLINNR
ncbi:ATP-binding protein [Alcaligenes phenolicus]|uniref:AAA family ATPase n=1 Tax=Alcaligenes phenolicus TaxID=232846 RepID=A0ABV2BDV7_9BURK